MVKVLTPKQHQRHRHMCGYTGAELEWIAKHQKDLVPCYTCKRFMECARTHVITMDKR